MPSNSHLTSSRARRRLDRPLLLCYHAVSSTWPASVAIPEATLEAQLSFFSQRGYQGLTFAEAERRRLGGTLPRRSLAVTFDDGFASILRALPTLEELGLPATVFVVTQFIERREHLCWPGFETWLTSEHRDEMRPLSWNELEGLLERGWEVGSHTVTHAHLPDLGDAALAHELMFSRELIARRLGSCETIAYPYGRADARVVTAARRAGYLAGCAFTPVYRPDERYRRIRIGLTAADSGLRFRAKVSAATRSWRSSRFGSAVDRLRMGYRDRRSRAYFRATPER
jgi:peptidoglycan/xylan/chitin deacetylase (PgdA/CDA1 family)